MGKRAIQVRQTCSWRLLTQEPRAATRRELHARRPLGPFPQIASDDAQARLSVCRPFHGLQDSHAAGGVPTFAHNTGEVNFRPRAPMQLASTLLCVLNRRDGEFLGLSKEELEAWHECLNWLREDGNNPVLRLYGTVYEQFVSNCEKFANELRCRGALPEGSMKARITFTKQPRGGAAEATLGDTLGQENSGVVIVDRSCNPMTQRGLGELASVVGTQEYRINVEVPNADGRGWQRRASVVDTASCSELGAQFRQDLATGAQFLAKEAYVKANDPHHDAKLWPAAHPSGTGSLLAETTTGARGGGLLTGSLSHRAGSAAAI